MMFLFLMIPLVASAPPQETTTGLQISVGVNDELPLGQASEIHVTATDVDTGLAVTDADCDLLVHDQVGSHISEIVDITATGYNYIFDLNENNFTEIGSLSFIVYCNNSLKGGLNSFEVLVNNYGESLTEGVSLSFNFAMIFLMILFVISLIGVFAIDNPAGKFACYWFAHILFVVGTFSVWQFNDGYGISYLGLAGIYKVLFYVSAIAIFPMIILSLAWIFYIHTMNDDIKKMMNRGMDEDEAFDRARRKRKW